MTSARVAGGTEITVISGGAADPGLDVVAAAFQKETGYTVSITYNLGTRGVKLMDDGEVVDVVVATSDSMNANFCPAGKVEKGGISIGRVGLGMMVRPGAPVPDMSGVDAFKRAVIEAEAVLITEEASGLRIEEVLRKVGIHEQVQTKIERYHNGPALIDRVLGGKGREIGFLPVSAIRTYKDRGIVLAGPLPEAVQHYLELMAAPSTRTANKEVAWAFVRYCGGPGKPLLVANGLT